MSHLNPETLARLIDEPTTEAEAGHLALCTMCTGSSTPCAPNTTLSAHCPASCVPTSWEVMRHRLEREGMLRMPRRRGRLAAEHGCGAGAVHRGRGDGVALAAIGAARGGGGRLGPGAGVGGHCGRWPGGGAGQRVRGGCGLGAGGGSSGAGAAGEAGGGAGGREPDPGGRARRGGGTTVALRRPAGPNWDAIARRASTAKTPDEAARFVRDAEGAYLAAMTRLAERPRRNRRIRRSGWRRWTASW